MPVYGDDDQGVSEERAEDDGREDQTFEDEHEGMVPENGRGRGRQRRVQLVEGR